MRQLVSSESILRLNQGMLTEGRFSTIDLLIEAGCSVKNVNNISILKVVNLN
jgi:hypothetical protein